ncbi:MAG: hypothetical protein JWQ43_2239 [Glaciihabitans sp.]|nr:hypothetical protein [Glaciihabitans sp.]
MTTEMDDEETIRQVIVRLTDKYPDAAPAEIESIARSEFEALAGRPVRDYLSILTERAAGKRLKKAAKANAKVE